MYSKISSTYLENEQDTSKHVSKMKEFYCKLMLPQVQVEISLSFFFYVIDGVAI